MSWGHVETNYDLPQISDHAPMLLTLSSSTWTGGVPFRFFNIWATHEDFSQIVASMWNSHSTQGTLKSVWTRLTDLKPALKALNSRKFRGITQKIEKARIDLRKARTRWIQLRDSNSKYFTAVMKDRTQRKQITEITTLLGDKLTDPEAIKIEIADFYKRLMGSAVNSLHAINRSYMKNGPTLSHQQRVDLCAEITDAIKEFFSTGKIYKAIKCTAVTLVPKVTKPTTVKECRPIACYSILYKMISNILASRLQKVMPFIISEAQAGFIPGRKIADNVMEEIGFPDMFIKWIMECIKTANYTILANLGKSSVYFGGVKQDVKEQILAHLGFEQGSLPFKYLGIPLSTKKIALLKWQPLIEKITTKIFSWSAKKLSYVGRVQLVQSVVFGIQAYWAQLFILPAKVLKMIETLCRSYIWSGTNTITRKALVAWEKICTPNSAGGLNLINLPL
nr:uncharacterized protein LOC104102245 [Nicotiana tomentosiformis]